MNPRFSIGERVLHSRVLARLMKRRGIDPGKYRILVDLFKELTQRKEMISLGNDTYSLQKVDLYSFALFGLLGAFLVFVESGPMAFLSVFVLIPAKRRYATSNRAFGCNLASPHLAGRG